MCNIMKLSLAAVALLSLGTVTARAQGVSGSITATALVFRPLTVTGVNNLDFGNVFPGVNKAIAVTDAGAGRFDVSGQTGANVQVSFVLPATLGDGTGNTMVIDTWTGNHNTTAAPTGTNFDPVAGASTALSGANPGVLFVYVGARVTPLANQPGGTYTGNVTMTVAYF